MITPHASIQSPHLLSSFDLCGLVLRNRVVMAPLTRARAGRERVPNALMTEYYTQHASAGPIIAAEPSQTGPLIKTLREQCGAIRVDGSRLSATFTDIIDKAEDPAFLADTIANSLVNDPVERQRLLEQRNTLKRLVELSRILHGFSRRTVQMKRADSPDRAHRKTCGGKRHETCHSSLHEPILRQIRGVAGIAAPRRQCHRAVGYRRADRILQRQWRGNGAELNSVAGNSGLALHPRS
jgi:hypothetical protein